MAMFRLDIKPISRARGQTATGAAAYRAGERIRDERTGEIHNHSRRKDVAHTEIFLPSQFGDAPMDWARDRARLWNTAESLEKRRNSRVAREFQISLPSELTATQRLTLARNFAREVSDRYGVAVDLALHDPKPSGDPRQFHAHLLTTTREVTPEGLGAKAGLDMQSVQRFRTGLTDHKTEYVAIRERWATLTNDALREANIEARVDHRSLEAQGIDRQPMVHVPLEFYRQQVKGLDPEGITRMRAQYKAWIDSGRTQQGEAHAGRTPGRQAQPPGAERPDPALQHPRNEPEPPAAPRTLAEIRRDAVQNWLRMRSKEVESPGNESNRQRANDVHSTRGQGEDLGK